MAEKHISLPKHLSNGDVNEWFQRYEICCKTNGWNETTKVLKFPILLEGEALAVWLELDEREQAAYVTTKKMIANLAPMGFVSLDDFHKRKLHPGESLSVFMHTLKKLLSQAMPALEGEARDQLLVHQLLKGLPRPVSRQIRATGETADLGKIVERARLLMTMENHEQTATVSKVDSKVHSLRDK